MTMNCDIMSEEFKNRQYESRKLQYKKHNLSGLFLEVTSRCNARCEHCGSSCGDFIPKDEVKKEVLIAALDDIAKNYDPKKIGLYVTGGEPLVRKDLFEIMDHANKLGFPWGMTSNGMLITQEIVDKMVETNMKTISISLDGPREIHEKFRKVPGSFDNIINGIKMMQKCPSIKTIQITTVCNKRNIRYLDDVYKIVKKLGVKEWRIIQVDPIGRAKNNKEILLEPNELKYMFNYILNKRKEDPTMNFRYGCGHFLGNDLNIALMENCYFCFTGSRVASILSNGDIFGCPDIERRKELIQGNINKDSFSYVWKHGFKNYRTVNRTSNSKCKKCPDWKSCGGDAFHTWDFKNNKPNFCVREIFKEKYKDEVVPEEKKTRKKTVKKSTKKSTTKTSTKKEVKKTITKKNKREKKEK